MAKIFNVSARAVVAKISAGPARALLRMGVSPDAVTVVGTLGVIAGALLFAVTGRFILGTVIITLCCFTDLIDGAMARARGTTSRFGAFLDSTCDRVADGAIFGSAAYWLAVNDRHWGATAALVCLVAGQAVSYAKARAEGLGMTANVGLVERAERLVGVGVGGLLTGFGVTYGLDVVCGILAIGSIYTLWQRMAVVYKQAAVLDAAARDSAIADSGKTIS
jgi:CDP-diacylglycerol---glycerol-3-phosphate 3-phosphatidyltransferase